MGYEEGFALLRRLGFEVVDPPVYECCLDTPERLATVATMRMGRLGLSEADVCSASGVSPESLEAITHRGVGSLHDMLAVLEVLKVRAYTLPRPSDVPVA